MVVLEMFLEGGLMTALGVVGGIFLNRYFDRQSRKDDIHRLKSKVADIEEENCLLCYGISACLDGLEQLGANSTVTNAKDKLEKHLNKKAHNQCEK